MEDHPDSFDCWAVLELMGHVRMAGRVTEEQRFGATVGRIDIPDGNRFTTVYFGGSSIYRMTPTTEEIARSVAHQNRPQPVHRWELPNPESPENVKKVANRILVDDEPEDDYDNEDDSRDMDL